MTRPRPTPRAWALLGCAAFWAVLACTVFWSAVLKYGPWSAWGVVCVLSIPLILEAFPI